MVLLVDYSSSVNIIIPNILLSKLSNLGLQPSIQFHFLLLSNFWVTRVCWSLSQLSWARGRGTPWIGRQTIAGLTLKDRQTFTLTHTYGQFTV